jgi:hypothetical protein
MTEPVTIRLEIITDNSHNYFLCHTGSVCRITLRNTSNYSVQLKYESKNVALAPDALSGNMALAPGALSETMIFFSGGLGNIQSRMMARAYVGSLALKKVIDGDGKTVELFNLDRIILPNTFHCTLCLIPIF